MPNYVSGTLLPWKRFWVPWDGKINCGDDGKGFLQNPEDDWGKFANPEVRAIETLLEKRCVILSGHPGTGKTIAVDNAVVELRRQANREVQVESVGGGKIDLKIESRSKSPEKSRVLVVIIEVKRCSHRDVADACKTQLVRGYLLRNGWTHGIYLVAWFGVGSASPARWTSIQVAQQAVQNWASDAATSMVKISGSLLDCRINAVEPPSSKRGMRKR